MQRIKRHSVCSAIYVCHSHSHTTTDVQQSYIVAICLSTSIPVLPVRNASNLQPSVHRFAGMMNAMSVVFTVYPHSYVPEPLKARKCLQRFFFSLRHHCRQYSLDMVDSTR